MSSRRLLVLIQALESDPDSMLSRERRDGDWSEQEYINATLVNELRLLRADSAAIHAGHKMDLNMVESPTQLRSTEDLSERQRAAREHIMSQLAGKKT
jgi:hypothetical protein